MKKLSYLIISTTVISCTCNNTNNQQAETYRPIPDPIIVYDHLSFGNGYNSITGQEFFGVLDYVDAPTSTEVLAGSTGNSGYVQMHLVDEKEELKNVLNISAKAELDLKIGGFTSENTAKVDVYRETKIDNFSQIAVISASYANEPLVLLNPTVKEKWIQLARKNPDEFMRTCGDMFVSRIYTGGNLYELFQLHGRDRYEKEKNDVFFKSVNKYLGNKLEVEGTISQENQQTLKTQNINTEVITEGGGNTPNPSDLQSFIEYANTFKTEVATDGRPIVLYVELSPYESIPGFPRNVNFGKIRAVQQEFIETAIEYINDIEESIVNANYVLDHEELFRKDDFEMADSIRIGLFDEQSLLKEFLARCKSDFNDCNMKKLEKEFESFIPFAPEIDFPEFTGINVNLPIDPDGGYVEVFANTEDQVLILSITGFLESRLRDNSAIVKCRDVYKDNQLKKLYEQYYETSWFTKWYIDISELYSQPYYMIRYTSTETNNVLRTFPWDGNPFQLEDHVKVEIKLVNPKSRLQMDIGSYHNKDERWIDVDEKVAEQIGKDLNPYFTGVRSCDAKPPVATISPKDLDVKVASEQKKSAFPKPILKNGSITYEYDF